MHTYRIFIVALILCVTARENFAAELFFTPIAIKADVPSNEEAPTDNAELPVCIEAEMSSLDLHQFDALSCPSNDGLLIESLAPRVLDDQDVTSLATLPCLHELSRLRI